MFCSKLKSFVRRFRPKEFSLKKRIFFSLAVLVLAAIVYLIVIIFSVDQTELQLAELRDSWRKEKICHEECARIRAGQEESIVSGLKAGPDSRAARRLKKYFLDEDEDILFRIELVSLARRAWGQGAEPEYFKKYLTDSDGQVAIQAEIISSYSSSRPLKYYFDILAGAGDWRLKQAAISVIGNYRDKAANFSADQLVLIKKIIFTPTAENRLRRSLILLLGDYRSLFPEETDEILRAVYKTESGGDPISRAFTADILNRLGGAKLAIPAISDAEWNEYYNN